MAHTPPSLFMDKGSARRMPQSLLFLMAGRCMCFHLVWSRLTRVQSWYTGSPKRRRGQAVEVPPCF